ncbi:MAG: outer membrane protein assembly factor BamB family protein [Acidimicrobiales bacterium]
MTPADIVIPNLEEPELEDTGPVTAPVPVFADERPEWTPPALGGPGGPGKPPRRRVSRRTLEVTGVVALVAVVLAVVLSLNSGSGTNHAAGTSTSTSTSLTTTTVPPVHGWSLPAVHVAGGPVLAGGRVLVLAVQPDKTLNLVAVDPKTGTIAWQVPSSPSGVSPSVILTPLTSGNVALNMAPAGTATSPQVTLQGIDITTGHTLWSEPAPATVVDPPALCTNESVFCVVEAQSSGAPQLVALAPATGHVTGSVTGPFRQMAPNLYETSASPPALEQLTPGGVPAWTAQVATLFGGTQYSPAYGWNFVASGSLDVGTSGVQPQGTKEPLSAFKTIGIRMTDGAVQWSTPGAYQCFAVLQIDQPFVCRYTGTGTYANGTLSTAGVTLTLQGLNLATGAVTWSHPVTDVQSLTTGNGVPIEDATHIVVTVGGAPQLLDLQSGALAPVPVGAVFWCGTTQQLALNAPAGSLANGQRVGATFLAPCTASGAPATATPGHPASSIGISVDGLFVWPSANGLTAVPVSG